MEKKQTYLEIESHAEAMDATIECTHMRDHSVRGACIDCMALYMHNFALGFARRALQTIVVEWNAIECGPQSACEQLIDRAIDEANDDSRRDLYPFK